MRTPMAVTVVPLPTLALVLVLALAALELALAPAKPTLQPRELLSLLHHPRRRVTLSQALRLRRCLPAKRRPWLATSRCSLGRL